MKKAFWATLLFASLSATAVSAQSYTSPSAFTCDAASRYPITSFSQFQCRGIKLASNGTVVGSFYWFSTGVVEVSLPSIPYPPDTYDSYITKVHSFTEPSGNTPGTFQFEWQDVDGNGVLHTGTASGTWEDQVLCGGRGCAWYAPKLLTFSTTAN